MSDSYSAPGNNLKKYREEELGWAKQQLADFAKAELKIQLSAKTIERVERTNGTFARITFTRILQTVNAAREKNLKLKPLSLEELFPKLTLKTANVSELNK